MGAMQNLMGLVSSTFNTSLSISILILYYFNTGIVCCFYYGGPRRENSF